MTLNPSGFFCPPLAAALVLVGTSCGESADIVITDDFAAPANVARWDLLEGIDNIATATAAWDAGRMVVGGAVARGFPLGAPADSTCEGSVRFLFPASPANYESIALTLYRADRDAAQSSRGYAMVIFKHPDAGGDAALRCNGTLQAWQGQLIPGEWHRLRFDCALGTMSMKVWPESVTEPAGWSLSTPLPGGLDIIAAAGLRSYGTTVTCDDFSVTGTPDPGTTPVIIGGATEGWRATIASNGRISGFEMHDGTDWTALPFRSDAYAGPGWFLRPGDDSATRLVAVSRVAGTDPTYEGTDGDLHCRTRYTIHSGALEVECTATNNGGTTILPKTLGIRLGMDSYMESHPGWNDKLFPTTLRCEPTHHWGYAMSPDGSILAWIGPDAAASWNLEYNGGGLAGSYGGKGGHRVYTASIGLLNKGPLPDHHPQNLDRLDPGESRTWRIRLMPLDDLATLKPGLSQLGQAPILEADRYTLAPGETSLVTVFGPAVPELVVTDPGGTPRYLTPASTAPGETRFNVPLGTPGLHTLRSTTTAGKTAAGTLYVRRPWSWYLQQARLEGLRVKPTATHHAECILPFHSYFLGRKHFPDATVDAQCEQVFNNIFPLHYDEANKRLKTSYRIQDTACWAGVLADRFAVTGDLQDLDRAANLVEFLIDEKQGVDGGYYNGATHYTNVIYIAKSIMETMREEAAVASTDPAWRTRYDAHLDSVRRAIDDLANRRDNIATEGQQTYEDGMISCAATQLAMFAYKEQPVRPIDAYLDAALVLDAGHRCLTLSQVPDARVNGATIRFWETQYTIHIFDNMLNSPCGWSAWKIYGSYYLYLLTGEEHHLRQAMNALGACAQVIDGDSGRLRWGFTPEPHIETRRAVKATNYSTPDHEYTLIDDVIGGQYLEMVSDWNLAQPVSRTKWGIDNLVHEIFKCVEEVALQSAFVIERADGSLAAYNCTATIDGGGVLRVTPAEALVSRVHLNLPAERRVSVIFGSGHEVDGIWQGLNWIGPGGVPEDIRPFLRDLGSVSFDDWKASAQIPAGQDGPQADPNRDGLPNLAAFFFGLHPVSQNLPDQPGPLRITRSGAELQLGYERNPWSMADGVLQFSPDLATPWQDYPDPPAEDPDGSFIMLLDTAETSANFFRLSISNGS